MKRIELIFIALIMTFGSFSLAFGLAFGEEAADDLDQGLAVPTCGHIYSSETHTLNSVVGLNISSASFILSCSDAADEMEMALFTPSGTEVNSESGEPVIYQKNASLIYYIIPYPEPGNWTAEITARAIQEKGEDYCAFTILDEEGAVMGDETAPESPSDISGELQDSGECEECNS